MDSKNSVHLPTTDDDDDDVVLLLADAPEKRLFTTGSMNTKRRLHVMCFTAGVLLLSVTCFGALIYMLELQRVLNSDVKDLTSYYHRLKTHVGIESSDLVILHLTEPKDPGWKVKQLRDDKCSLQTSAKVDCYPGPGAEQEKCEAKGCCWVPVGDEVNGIPWCFYPVDSSVGYKVDSISATDVGMRARYSREDKSIWPNDVMTLQLDTFEETDTRFHFKIYDPNKRRFEVPVDTPKVSTKSGVTDYKVELAEDVFGIKVFRNDTSLMTLFDTTGTKLTYADQYLEITTVLPTNYIYGLGEHRDPLLHDVSKGFSMSMWARDIPPPGCDNCNLYGQHPFFLAIDDKTKMAYGAFILNSNAMEVIGTPAAGDEPARLTYKTTGGVLDFYIFTGPTPALVVQQYLQVIGFPYLPPYWALGFHLCRWGYDSTDKMKQVIKRMRDYGFPYDTQWNDIDYMDNHYDWTYDKTNFAHLPAVVKDLHDNGQHYMMIVDAGIPNKTGYPAYDEGVQQGVFVLYADRNEPLIGRVWPGFTAFPDFFNPATQKWWLKQAQQYFSIVPFDGLWIDMNEPSNFVPGSVEGCTNSSYDNPPFVPPVLGGSLMDKTLCPSARHATDIHYNLHSLYGLSMLIASQSVMQELRPSRRTFIVSRSTFPSSGRYGSHWEGDNESSWDDLKYSIAAILNFQLFGIPFVGADVCGFIGVTTPELCVRWMQLGAFYPFMRNHNIDGSPDQDPAAPMFTDEEKQAMKKALELRYSLLPFLYTLLAHAHINGTMVVRPLWVEYFEDVNTFTNQKQFMWGESLLVAPVLDQGATSVDAYLPKDTWLDMSGTVYQSSGEVKTISAPLDKIPLFLRAGSIIPWQTSNVTTTLSRMNPFGLIVVLDINNAANGSLYWDDGDTLNATENGVFNLLYFAAKDGHLTVSIAHSGYSGQMLLDRISLGIPKAPVTGATVNGKSAQVTKLGDVLYGLVFDAVDLMNPVTVAWW